MGSKELYAAVTSCGIPCRRNDWGDEKPPKLPWAVYTCEDTPYASDNRTYGVKHYWTVELYEDRHNKKLEDELYAALEEAFGPSTRREVWVNSQKCLMVTYDFAEIETFEEELIEEPQVEEPQQEDTSTEEQTDEVVLEPIGNDTKENQNGN